MKLSPFRKGGRRGELFRRVPTNPIICSEMFPKEAEIVAVLNPGITFYQGRILLLARVVNNQETSSLWPMISEDGIKFSLYSKNPLTADAKFNEAPFGLEDPRITCLEEENRYLISCVSFEKDVPRSPPTISLIGTTDFKNFKRISRPFPPENKDGALFPEKIGGNYILCHRPLVGGRMEIWISFSPDLTSWGNHRRWIPVGETWNKERVGIGPPPIKTEKGWLIIYHGVRETASGRIYRVGAALADLKTLKIIYHPPGWIFAPEERYERIGNTDNVVFPTGALIKDGKLLLYYGVADTSIGLATADLSELLSYICRFPV